MFSSFSPAVSFPLITKRKTCRHYKFLLQWLNVSYIFNFRENPHFHPQQVRVSVREKAGQDEPVPSGSEDTQRCPLCPFCHPPRQRWNARDCAWGQAKHSLLDLLGQDGRAVDQCGHARHPVLGWVPKLLDQLEGRRCSGEVTKEIVKRIFYGIWYFWKMTLIHSAMVPVGEWLDNCLRGWVW